MSHASFARRHRVLIGALVLLAAALAVAATALLDRERAMQRLSKEQVYWSVAQAEIELYRFLAELESFGRGDPLASHDGVVRRFDIFWSRMGLFEGGDVAQRILAFPGAAEAVEEARAIMESEEEAVMALQAGDGEEIGRMHRRFDQAGLALHRLAVAVNQAEIRMLAELREELRTEVVALIALVGGMISGGVALVLLLARENRRSRDLALFNRQFVAAADVASEATVLARRQGDRMVVVYANEAFRRLAGDDGIEGAELADLFERRLGPHFVQPIEQALHGGVPIAAGELALGEGEAARWLLPRLTPVADGQGRVDALMIELEDVGPALAARRAIEAARDDAMRANAAKSRFVAVMSHEIRTPMNGVLGALGLIAQRNGDGELDGLIETARVSGEALLAILNDVLDVTRMEAGQLKLDRTAVALPALLRSVAGAWAPLAAEKGVALEVQLAPTVPAHVAGDAARLRQMLVNLVSNAVKFTDSGTIRIVATAHAGDAGHHLVRIAVEDSGPGIAEGDRDRLFREYDQLAQHGRGGTGLGLAIVRRLAALMGGEVGVDSAPGRGSAFWFELPLERVAAPAARADAPALVFDGLQVLVAEDNATNRLVVSEILKDLGCRVRLAENGEQAVRLAGEAPPDIVLMDIAMPVMDGHEAHARLRAAPGTLAGVPVVALTAYAMTDEVAGFLAEGFDAVLPKPVVREALAETLARLTGRGRAAPLSVASGVDRGALASLLGSVGPEAAGRLVVSFAADVDAALGRVADAIAGDDIAALEHDSHMLAGLAGTFGLAPLSAAARRVNAACRAGAAETARLDAATLVAVGRAGLADFRRLTAEPTPAVGPALAMAGRP